MNCAIYARYSTDLQNQASIEDQLRLCRERAAAEGWPILECYTDAAISGASLMRPGIQQLMQDAMAGRFQIILAEALDRLSRNLADIAGLYQRLTFAGVRIVTLSEGEITDLHIGLKGTMNSLQLKDLAEKVRRGLRGRVEAGKSGGGNSFGYDVVRRFNAGGEPIRGERVINQTEAGIVRRIFNEFARGDSPRTIAGRLNAGEDRGTVRPLLGRINDPRPPCQRDRNPQQRPLHRPRRLEQTAVSEGPGDRETRVAAQS